MAINEFNPPKTIFLSKKSKKIIKMPVKEGNIRHMRIDDD